MAKRFSVNGSYYDFATIELGLLGLTRLPNELMSLNCGDAISRQDIEGTGQVPLGESRGRYKCDNLQIKTTVEAAKELHERLAASSPTGSGIGNGKLAAFITLQNFGEEPVVYAFPEISLISQKEAWSQQDACLAVTLEFKSRYMTRNGLCLGDISR
jgi:hypothetical protein